MRFVDRRYACSSELQVESHSPGVEQCVEEDEASDDCHVYACDFRRAEPSEDLHSAGLEHNLHNPKHY